MSNRRVSLEKGWIWRVVYVGCCLVYVPWVVYLSFNNFDMVHSDYRSAVERLQPAQVEKIALRELVEQCRKESKRKGHFRKDGDKTTFATAESTCLSLPAAVLGERQKAVEERLIGEQSRAKSKLVLFYVFFGVIFLILPTVIGYLLLSFFLWIYRNITFIK